MQKIKIVCVGKIKEKYFTAALEEYEKRLSRYCKFEVIEVADVSVPDRPSDAQIADVLRKEGESILKKIEGEKQIVALCVEGKQKTSEQFASFLSQSALAGDCLCFVIGGSHGLWEEVKKKATLRLSFSEMTFPHQLMRVVLAEQIYRGFKINCGEQYHK
ncbi:MAG: 23S rRNA (pseudouridine(1915)-N(3))-methyltransferase RlmH [Ruminococcaceae bacterium]|nr:23S rRNA (pseudouridine(1915)-N(3))-methyltransferase RlmH [Oscillospiraceae bacterium]